MRKIFSKCLSDGSFDLISIVSLVSVLFADNHAEPTSRKICQRSENQELGRTHPDVVILEHSIEFRGG